MSADMFDDLDSFQPSVVSSPVRRKRRRSPLDGRQEQWAARHRQEAYVLAEPLIRYSYIFCEIFYYLY